jgi:prevent-host-death family protein
VGRSADLPVADIDGDRPTPSPSPQGRRGEFAAPALALRAATSRLRKQVKKCTIRQNYVQNVRLMKSYPLNAARAEFSKLVDRALAGEPQRVTRHGKKAVVIVSEDAWLQAQRGGPATLGALLARHARAGTLVEAIVDRPWAERPLGGDFE